MKIRYLLPLAGLLLSGCATQTHTVATPPPGPSLAEVQCLVQAHVSDSVVVTQIQNSSTRYYLTADQIISLKNAGVSDTVIKALINTASKSPPQTITVVNQYPYYYPYWYGGPWGPYYYYGVYYRGGYYRGGYYYRH
jgi:hypothetical protein